MHGTTLPKRKRVRNHTSLQSAGLTNASAGQAGDVQQGQGDLGAILLRYE